MAKAKKVLTKVGIFLSILIFFILVVLGLFYYTFEVTYADKIYPNVYIGEINMEGKTPLEAKDIINNQLNIVNQKGITFDCDNSKSIIYPVISSADATIADVLIGFKTDETVKKAISIGRSGKLIDDSLVKLSLLLKSYKIDLAVDFDDQRITNFLKQDFSLIETKNAGFYFEGNILSIKEGHPGKTIDYENGISSLRNNLGKLIFSNINLKSVDSNPEILGSDCLMVKDSVSSFLNLAPIKLKYNGREWLVTKSILLNWIALAKTDNNVSIGLSKDKIREYVEGTVAKAINQDSITPKFTLNNGKVENFQSGKQGFKLNIDATVNVLSELLNNPIKQLDLSVSILPMPENSTGESGNLGIKEIIGSYALKFDGSTNARISNIKNGAKSLNGLLIKPNEEFSTLQALGTIDEAHGYVKEAIIKDNAISYDFGGGLCHLSTTLFRTVLESGLSVTMRQNHSYNMPYYAPGGVDATIYDPTPDFKFVNDTNNYILIQAEVVNGALAIELWGTNDGRVINKSEPYIYNIVKPLPTRIIMTNTLYTGQKKCTYVPYDGADAYFDYAVTYPDGTIKKKRFNSHYIPRQGVCLVGI